ncbi:MAG: SGNH/GDSL hydrolase family protein [Candidatus Nanopelagicales bacterium]
MSRAQAPRRTTVLASLGAAAALAASLLGTAAPAQAAPAAAAPRAVVRPTAVAPTVLTSAMDRCLRQATADPGGAVVITDARISATESGRISQYLRMYGRTTCVLRSSGMTVSLAQRWWRGLPAGRQPGTVVLALRGSAVHWSRWSISLPARHLLGTVDSGAPLARRVTGWTRGVGGVTASRAILTRLGELMVYGHAWGGTSELLLKRSSAAQCAKAVASPRGVLVLGDSITSRDFAGIHTGLIARGWVPCVFAQSSSRIYEHLSRLILGKVPLPHNIVIALGNNDIFTGRGGYPVTFRAQAKALLARLKGHNIVFPTVWRTKKQPYLRPLQHNAAVVNNVIRDLARGVPTIRVPNWAAVIQRRPTLQYDGIHLTPAGLAARYDMFSASLESLVAANPAPPAG